MDPTAVVYGEVGLGGDIRSATASQKRLAEARKLGFEFAVAPPVTPADSFVRPVRDVRSALQTYLTHKTKVAS